MELQVSNNIFSELKRELYSAIAKLFKVDVDVIQDDLGPGDIEPWDSLGQLQLVSKLEELYQIKFSVDDLMAINTAYDIVNIVSNYISTGTKTIVENQTADDSMLLPDTKSLFDSAVDVPKVNNKVEKINAVDKKVCITSLQLPKSVFSGIGSVFSLKSIKSQHIVVVTGSGSYVDKIKDSLNVIFVDKKITYLAKPDGEPTVEGINYLFEQLLIAKPQSIIAIGGGSVIDIARCAWILYEKTGSDLNQFMIPFSLKSLRSKSDFTAVPTTFGSGAEASSAIVFSENSESNKSVLVSHELLPDMVVLDPSLAEGASFELIFKSAMDALTHSIEGFVSTISNPMADMYAVQACTTILRVLDTIIKNDKQTTLLNLEDLSYASYFAGIVQNHCSVGLCHSIAHQLSGYGVDHASANALLLGAVMSFNAKESDRFKILAEYLKFDSVDSMIKFINNIVLRANLTIDNHICLRLLENVDQICEQTKHDITYKTNPRRATKDDIKVILEAAFQFSKIQANV